VLENNAGSIVAGAYRYVAEVEQAAENSLPYLNGINFGMGHLGAVYVNNSFFQFYGVAGYSD